MDWIAGSVMSCGQSVRLSAANIATQWGLTLTVSFGGQTDKRTDCGQITRGLSADLVYIFLNCGQLYRLQGLYFMGESDIARQITTQWGAL